MAKPFPVSRKLRRWLGIQFDKFCNEHNTAHEEDPKSDPNPPSIDSWFYVPSASEAAVYERIYDLTLGSSRWVTIKGQMLIVGQRKDKGYRAIFRPMWHGEKIEDHETALGICKIGINWVFEAFGFSYVSLEE